MLDAWPMQGCRGQQLPGLGLQSDQCSRGPGQLSLRVSSPAITQQAQGGYHPGSGSRLDTQMVATAQEIQSGHLSRVHMPREEPSPGDEDPERLRDSSPILSALGPGFAHKLCGLDLFYFPLISMFCPSLGGF